MSQLIVVGAYGRKYYSKASVLKDWNGDLDFKIVAGPYINKTDALRYDVDIRFRWGANLEFTAPLRQMEIEDDQMV